MSRVEHRPVLWLLFDGRYTVDPDYAACYSVCGSQAEAEEAKHGMFPDAVIVRCRRTGQGQYAQEGEPDGR